MAEIILKEEETINVTLKDEEVINVSLEETEPIDVKVEDINYIPGYIAEEEKRRANEEERISYYEDFKGRAENGEFDGKDGAIQYTAGTNIEITEDNVINCTATGGGGGGVSEEIDPTVPDYVKAITEADINNWNSKSEFSGDYNDLSNKPTIPTVPTNVSAFTNDAGYIKDIPSEYVTESELDGKGYITDLSNYYTKEETDTQISEKTIGVYDDLGRFKSEITHDIGNVEQLETDSKVIVGAINELRNTGGADYDSLPVGTIVPFGGNDAPDGYLLCDGSKVARSEYPGLFEAIGTSFNLETDTDSTMFRLPNLKGKIPVGLDETDEDFNTIGKEFGEKEHQLTVEEMPKHRHGIELFGNTVLMNQGGQYGTYIGTGYKETQDVGGEQPHNNVQPSLVVNYIIKASGTSVLKGNVVDSLEGNSTTNAPSIRAVNEIKSKFNVLWSGSFSPTEHNVHRGLTIDENVYDYDFLLIDVSTNDSDTEKTTVTLVIEGEGVACGVRGNLFYLLDSYRLSFGIYTDGYKTIYLKIQDATNYTYTDLTMNRIIGVKL